RVRAGTRVSYVPAAALVVRSAALLAAGGFDEGLRWGEDVDLVWRLDEAGRQGRYAPTAGVGHEPRATPRGGMAPRAAYGSSAAALAERHPGAVPAVAVSGWSAAVWVLAMGGAPVLAVAVAGGTAAALIRKLKGLPRPAFEAVMLAGRGHLFAG